MPNEDQSVATPPPMGSGRRRRPWVIFAALALAGLLVAVVTTLTDDEASDGSRSEGLGSSPSEQSSTTVDSEEELVSRLEEILAIREQAYRSRDPEILNEIYSVGCPCLKSDSNAIRELIREGYVWVGGETSIRVRRAERVTERMWIIVADFHSEALRIETESGGLVRSEPRGQDLFEFVLAKPAGSTQWLLGRAAASEDG